MENKITTMLRKNESKHLKQNYLCKKYNLTKREGEIMLCTAQGLTDKEISTELFIALPTVRKHMDNLRRKLRVRNKGQIINIFHEL
jgi:NarL family two-component system response regulator LiaR